MPSWLPTLIFVPLVGFGLYRRYKRTFGEQPFTPKRMIARMVLLVAITVLLVVTSPLAMTDIALAGGGFASGLVLAVVGLAYTQFQITPKGKTYTPNRWIGLVVTALFVGRLVARFATLTFIAAPPGSGGAAATGNGSPFGGGGVPRSPLTLGIFCLMAAYYIFYYGGVLWKGRSLGATPPPPAATS